MALEVPSEWKAYLSVVQSNVEAAVPGAMRWVRPQILHLTLAFLGEQPTESLATIQRVLSEVAGETTVFRLEIGTLGTFGQGGLVRTIWAAVNDPCDCLPPLHARLSSGLEGAEVSQDRQAFRPHVTLGRVRERATLPIDSQLAPALRTLPKRQQPPAFSAREIALFRSQLLPSGPLYTAISTHSFAPRDR